MGEEAARPSSPWRAAVLVGVLSAVLGVITLGDKALWYDEAFNAEHIPKTWGTVIDLVRRTEMSQAAYLVGLKQWAALTGTSEVWLRVPSVIAAALAAALLVPLGARVFDRTTGIVAGFLLATNGLLVSWSQQARTYALVTMAVVVASLLFVRALDDPRRRNWLLYAVAAAFAVYCHFYAGFVIVAHLASLPLAPRRPPLRRVVEAAGAFVALIAVAVYFTATAERAQLIWIVEPSLNLVRNAIDVATGRNVAAGLAAVGGLLVLAFRAGEGTTASRWRFAFVGGWIVLPIALGLLVSTVQPIFVTRYLIVIAPALGLAAAVLLVTLIRARRAVAVLGVAALVAVVAMSGREIVQWYRSSPEDWRGAVAFVERERRPGDAVVVAPAWSLDPFRYYAPTTPLSYAPFTGRTFVIVRVGERDDPAALVRYALGPTQLELVRERRFGRRMLVQELGPPT